MYLLKKELEEEDNTPQSETLGSEDTPLLLHKKEACLHKNGTEM